MGHVDDVVVVAVVGALAGPAVGCFQWVKVEALVAAVVAAHY